MFIKKRIIPLLLVLALLPTFLSVPASAADLDDDQSGHYNLLVSTGYNLYRNGVMYSKGLEYPNKYVSVSNKSLAYEWTPGVTVNRFDEVYITLYCHQQPTSVEFQPYSGRTYSAVFLGKYGEYSQYKVTMGSDLGAITVRANWSSGYTGNFGIVSCTGVLTGLSRACTNIDIFGKETFFTAQNNQAVTSTNIIVNSNDWALPNMVYYNSGRQEDWSFKSTFYLTVNPDDHSYDYLDYIEFNVSAVEVSLFTASIVDSTGTVLRSIDVDVSQGQWKTTLIAGGNEFWLYNYTVRVDLNGVDLSQDSLQLSVDLDSYFNADEVALYFLEVHSVIYRLYVDELPWYQIFYRWINKTITRTTDSIIEAINNISAVFGENGQLQQAGEAMSNQASSMQAANNQLDSVEKPSVDTGQLLDNFLSFNTGGMTILSSLTNNSFVPQLMVVVFTFALCGYIFFGKKG